MTLLHDFLFHAQGQTVLKFFHQQGTRQRQSQIHQGDDSPDFDCMQGAGHEFNTLETQFLDGNNRDNRRILDQGEKLPGHGRHDALEGLGQNDVPHLLIAGKT